MMIKAENQISELEDMVGSSPRKKEIMGKKMRKRNTKNIRNITGNTRKNNLRVREFQKENRGGEKCWLKK